MSAYIVYPPGTPGQITSSDAAKRVFSGASINAAIVSLISGKADTSALGTLATQNGTFVAASASQDAGKPIAWSASTAATRAAMGAAGLVSPAFTTPDIGAGTGTSLVLSGGIGTGIFTTNVSAGGRADLKITSGIPGYAHDTIAFYETYDGGDVFHIQIYHKSLILGGKRNTTQDAAVFIVSDNGKARALDVEGNSQFTGSISASGTVKTGSMTVAVATAGSSALAVSAGAGAQTYISDESGGASPAWSDGTVWRRASDRASIS